MSVTAETLLQKQFRFSRNAARLIVQAFGMGYGVTLGEAWRTPEQAKLNEEKQVGTSTSLHMDRLAIDLNLFKDERYITNDEGHKELGAWWKQQGPDFKWGGDFKKKDYNHYSITPDWRRA